MILIALVLFSSVVNAAECPANQITNVSFAYDDDGKIQYTVTPTKEVPLSTSTNPFAFFVVATGTCGYGDYVYFDISDVINLPVPIYSKQVYFANGDRAITYIRPDVGLGFISGHTYRVKVRNAIWSTNNIKISTSATCGNGILNTNNPFEPCDASAGGTNAPSSFYDGQNTVTQFGFDGGTRLCYTNLQCGISFRNACELQLASVAPNCNGDCDVGEKINVSGTRLRRTNSVTDGIVNCRLEPGDKVKVKDSASSCEVELTANNEPDFVQANDFIDMYPAFSYLYTISSISPACSSRQITSARVAVLTDSGLPNGQYTEIANAIAQTNFRFGVNHNCVAETFFARNSDGTNRVGTEGSHYFSSPIYACVSANDCVNGDTFSVGIYDTDNGVSTDGFIQNMANIGPISGGTGTACLLFPPSGWPPLNYLSDSGDSSFSNNDATTEYMINASNIASGGSLTIASTNYAEVSVTCSDGTALNSCSATRPGEACVLVNGVPTLRPNCAGQAGVPACSCSGGTCMNGDFAYYSENMESFTVQTSKIFNSGGGSLQAFVNNQIKHAGAQSLKLIQGSASGYSAYVFNISGLVAGTSYTASAYVFTTRSNFARIYGNPTQFTESNTFSAFHAGDGQWQKLSFTFTASSSTYNVMAEVKSAQADAYFDDIAVSESAIVCVPVGNECHITDATITPVCGTNNCQIGESIRVIGHYDGSNCPVNAKLQVDALDSMISCAIEWANSHNLPNGFIQGMRIDCTSGTCNALWPITSIPADCVGKAMSATASGLYDSNGIGIYYGGPASGSFRFNGAPVLTSATSNIPSGQITYGTPITVTGTGSEPDNDQFRLQCSNQEQSSNYCLGNYVSSSPATCNFTAPWNDNLAHTIYCRLYDGTYLSNVKEITFNSDVNPEIVSINSPDAGSWQNSNFDVGVSFGSSLTCKYEVKSNNVLTKTQNVPCTTNSISISVSSSGDCKNEGSNSCEVIITGYDSVGNPGTASRRFSITFGTGNLDVTVTPVDIGAPTYYEVKATATSSAGVKDISITLTIDGTALPPAQQTFQPGQTTAELKINRSDPAGSVIEYTAVMHDYADQTSTRTGTFKVCDLKTAHVSASCTNCYSGNTVTASVTYDGKCPATSYIDLSLDAEDGTCDISTYLSGAELNGIRFTCTSGTCSSTWTIPSNIPGECFGKTVSPFRANLWQGSYPSSPPDYSKLFDVIQVPEPGLSGSFTFGYPPGSCGNIVNNTCASLGSRPDFCASGVVKKRADICGCNNGFWMMQNISIGSDTQYDCVPAVCSNTDYLTCEQTNSQNTGFFCDGVPSGGGTNIISNLTLYPNPIGQWHMPPCSCPPGQDPGLQPYWSVYTKGFESAESITFQNLNESSGNGGIFNGGYAGLYSYYITKTNIVGESRALLPIQTVTDNTYTVYARVSTDVESFARIYDRETHTYSQYVNQDGWQLLQYTFTASGTEHNIALSVSSAAGTAAFDSIEVKEHDLVCTAICIDGTSNTQCSIDGWGPPYYCDANADEYPNLIRNSDVCGCPEGEEPDGGGGCAPFSCEPDATPYGECSLNNLTGQYDDIGGSHGILFCNNGQWIESPEACGCESSYGYDSVTNTCVDCSGQINPPIGGYLLCEQTGGEFSSEITIENLTCTEHYDCTCPDGKIFDSGFGCVSTCRENNICEPFESGETCPADCPIEWSNVETSVTDTGAHFEGTLDVTFMLGFRTCKGSSSVEECSAVPLEQCNANSSCLCGSPFNKYCDVVCHDTRNVYYLFGEGTHIPPQNPFDARNVAIASDVGNFSCPVFHMEQLEQHYTNFLSIRQSAFIGLEQAIINLERAASDEDRQQWQQQINIFNEVIIVDQAHIDYLKDVFDGVNTGRYGLAKVNEAFALTAQKYQEILDILAGHVTLFSMDINLPEVLEVPYGQSVNANTSVLVKSFGNATRWARVSCMLSDPNGTSTLLTSVCSDVQPDGERYYILNKTMNKFGSWPINYCALNISSVSTCAASMEFLRFDNVGTTNITQLSLLGITSISAPEGEIGIGEQISIVANVQNIDSEDHVGYVQCSLRDPRGTLVTLTSVNNTVVAESSLNFEMSATANQQGTWNIGSCTVYRIGSVINEGSVAVNQRFDVGPPSFLLSPASGSGSTGPGGTMRYNVTIKNTGILPETYTYALTTTNNWSASVSVNKTGTLRLAKGESATFYITLTHRSNVTPETITTLTVSSSLREKSSVFTTTVSYPNRPPEISMIESPDRAVVDASVTFSAEITDEENSDITAKVCIGDCSSGCTMEKSGSVYLCRFIVSLPIGSYVYFINASDGNATQLSDSFNLQIVSENYCEEDNECNEGYECRNHVCREAITCPGTKAECYLNGDVCESCGSGYNCVSGVCRLQAECNRDEDCSDGRLCKNYKCEVSLAGTCGDGVCSTGEQCTSDCGTSDESPILLIIAVVIVIAVFIGLVLYIRKRREEEEDYL